MEVFFLKMLRLLNNSKRSQKAIWILASVVVVAGMVVFYAPMRGTPLVSNSGKELPLGDKDLVAKVDKEIITAQDYMSGLTNMMQMYKQFMNQGGKEMDLNQVKSMGLDKNLLQSLIRKKIVELEIKRLNLEASDEEVKARIREQFTVEGKWIGYDKYQRYIERSGQTVSQFEQSLREQIADEKLRSLITSAIQISPQEVQEQFNRENTTFNVVYSVVDSSKLTDKVTVDDAELKTYFDKHKAEFHIEKTQRKAEYIYVSQEAVSKTLQVTDEELKKDYDPEKFVSEVRVQQILLKALAEKDKPEVQKKAAELITRAKGASGAKAEDFGTLARGNSQDTATKDKDGDLGFIKKDSLKPGSYLQRAFAMQPNEISDLVTEGNNFYILKVTERKNKTFEEAKESLLASARNRLAYKKASELADDVVKQLAEKKDIKAVVADIAQKQGLTPEQTLKQTPLFAAGDNVPDIGSNPSFEEAVANLKAVGDVGVKTGVRGGFAIAKLLELKEPHDATLEEVKDKVVEKYKKDKVKDVAAEQAKSLLAAANNTTDGLKAAIEKAGLKAETRDDFRDGQSLENFNDISKVLPIALKLKVGEISKDPIFGNDKYLVFGITKRTDPDTNKYNTESGAVKEKLLEERRSMTYDAYLDSIKKKMKSEGKIIVKKDIIDKLFQEMAAPPAQ